MTSAPTSYYHGGNTNNDSEESDQDELHEEELIRLEEEEERALSKLHGEAAESGDSPSKKKKRSATQTDKEIEQDFAKSSAEEQRTNKKPRPTLTPAHVIGPRGLIKIKRDFPQRLKSKRYSSAKNGYRGHEADFSKRLISCYKSFCFELFPHMASEDVLSRVEVFGSKAEVRKYLEMMRGEVRRDVVERIYGMEKADEMLKELENGSSKPDDAYDPHTVAAEYDDYNQEGEMEENGTSSDVPLEEQQPQAQSPKKRDVSSGRTGEDSGENDVPSPRRAILSRNPALVAALLRKKQQENLDEGETEAVFEDAEDDKSTSVREGDRGSTASDQGASTTRDELDENIETLSQRSVSKKTTRDEPLIDTAHYESDASEVLEDVVETPKKTHPNTSLMVTEQESSNAKDEEGTPKITMETPTQIVHTSPEDDGEEEAEPFTEGTSFFSRTNPDVTEVEESHVKVIQDSERIVSDASQLVEDKTQMDQTCSQTLEELSQSQEEESSELVIEDNSQSQDANESQSMAYDYSQNTEVEDELVQDATQSQEQDETYQGNTQLSMDY